MKRILVDLDGVLHGYTKKYRDGTMYDMPVQGAREALAILAQDFEIWICTSRLVHPDVDDNFQRRNIWLWLARHGMAQYVTGLTGEKLHSEVLIDDRCIRFDNWENTLKQLREIIEN